MSPVIRTLALAALLVLPLHAAAAGDPAAAYRDGLERFAADAENPLAADAADEPRERALLRKHLFGYLHFTGLNLSYLASLLLVEVDRGSMSPAECAAALGNAAVGPEALEAYIKFVTVAKLADTVGAAGEIREVAGALRGAAGELVGGGIGAAAILRGTMVFSVAAIGVEATGRAGQHLGSRPWEAGPGPSGAGIPLAISFLEALQRDPAGTLGHVFDAMDRGLAGTDAVGHLVGGLAFAAGVVAAAAVLPATGLGTAVGMLAGIACGDLAGRTLAPWLHATLFDAWARDRALRATRVATEGILGDPNWVPGPDDRQALATAFADLHAALKAERRAPFATRRQLLGGLALATRGRLDGRLTARTNRAQVAGIDVPFTRAEPADRLPQLERALDDLDADAAAATRECQAVVAAQLQALGAAWPDLAPIAGGLAGQGLAAALGAADELATRRNASLGTRTGARRGIGRELARYQVMLLVALHGERAQLAKDDAARGSFKAAGRTFLGRAARTRLGEIDGLLGAGPAQVDGLLGTPAESEAEDPGRAALLRERAGLEALSGRLPGPEQGSEGPVRLIENADTLLAREAEAQSGLETASRRMKAAALENLAVLKAAVDRCAAAYGSEPAPDAEDPRPAYLPLFAWLVRTHPGLVPAWLHQVRTTLPAEVPEPAEAYGPLPLDPREASLDPGAGIPGADLGDLLGLGGSGAGPDRSPSLARRSARDAWTRIADADAELRQAARDRTALQREIKTLERQLDPELPAASTNEGTNP